MTRLFGRRGWPSHAAGPLDAVVSTPGGAGDRTRAYRSHTKDPTQRSI